MYRYKSPGLSVLTTNYKLACFMPRMHASQCKKRSDVIQGENASGHVVVARNRIVTRDSWHVTWCIQYLRSVLSACLLSVTIDLGYETIQLTCCIT